MNEDYYGEALKKLTEVVKELNVELAELKKDYKNHGHDELVQKKENCIPTETVLLEKQKEKTKSSCGAFPDTSEEDIKHIVFLVQEHPDFFNYIQGRDSCIKTAADKLEKIIHMWSSNKKRDKP